MSRRIPGRHLGGSSHLVAEAGDEVVAPSLRRRERLDEATWVEEGDGIGRRLGKLPSMLRERSMSNGVVARLSASGKLPTKVPVGQTAEIADVVYAKVREIGRERVGELNWDTNILELGLDSLERMEIVASLEEAFGGRFPEQVLPSMETCGEVVEAIQRYMGGAAKRRSARPDHYEVHPEDYDFAQSADYLRLQTKPANRPTLRTANSLLSMSTRALLTIGP